MQAKFFLDSAVGNYKTKDHKSYENLVEGMYDAAVKYDQKGYKVLEGFIKSLYLNASFKNKNSVKRMMNEYLEEIPLAKECNDINFLYLANYIITYKKSDLDQEFIDDVKDVIEASIVIEKLGLSEYDNNKDYKKVAKFTLKNIKNYEKAQEKAAAEEKKLTK